MAESNHLLDKLDGLVSRFEEVSTLITDPAVIADQKRYVKLTKEYKDLGKIVEARKEYIGCLQNVADAKEMLAIEEDAETKEMLREELSQSEKRIPELEEEIKLLLVPADPEDGHARQPRPGRRHQPRLPEQQGDGRRQLCGARAPRLRRPVDRPARPR